MNGMINQPQAQQENPMLTRMSQDAEAKVPSNLKQQFMETMAAVSKLMWDKSTRPERQEFDQAMKSGQNPILVIVHAALKIVQQVQQESGLGKPIDVMGLVLPIILSQIIQYAESRDGFEVTPEVVSEIQMVAGINLLRIYGVKEEHIKELFMRAGQMQGQEQPEQAQPATPLAGQPTQPEEEA